MDERLNALKRYITKELTHGETAYIQPNEFADYPLKEFIVYWEDEWPSTFLVLTDDESRVLFDQWANETLYNRGIDFFLETLVEESANQFIDETASCIILPYRKQLQQIHNLNGPATDGDLTEIFGDLTAAIDVAVRKNAIDTHKFPRIVERFYGRGNAFNSKDGFEDKQGGYLIYQI